MGTTQATNEALEDRLLDFAARCGLVVDALPETRMGRHVAGQLVRCGTSSAPNYAEACAAESRNDFIHKLGVALKELRESRVWLKLCIKCKLLPVARLAPLTDECNQLIKILGKSIVTATTNSSAPVPRRPRREV
ncbi:MAG: four helix bundle protein [Candidatus Saccharimonas sp.]|nr:four helix bundle protein [Planctomycetaceae bacterium]